MPDESNPNEGSHGRELDKDGELSHGKIAEPSTETKAAEAEDLKEVTQDNKEEKEKTEDNRSTAAETTQETPPNSERSSAWLNWFPRPKSDPNDSSKEDKAQTQTWEVDKAEQSDSQPKPEADQETGDKPAVEAGHTTHVDTTPSTRPKRTWLQTLTSTSPASHEKKASDAVDPSQETQKPVDNTSEPIQSNETVNSSPENAENVGDTKRTGHTAKPSSGWIFWSRERPTQESGGDDGQSSEEPATRDISTEQKIAPTTKVDQPRESQQSTKEVKKQTKKAVAHGPPTDDAVPAEPSPFDSTAESGTEPAKPTKPSATRKTQLLPNQLLPSVKKTFPTKRRPSLIQQLNRWLYSNNSSQPKHVALAREPPRVKKALAIGIHGYFPAPLIRTVLGQPTGTSVKFSDQAAKAISEWADSHDNPCEVEKISLEGEGRIEERLELLWKLLLNWIEHIRTADFIMVACHSQGVPVATMLVAKLIAFGCVNSARIGICAMAGVNLGLFPDYKSRWISGSAGELFDFADSTSEVSKEYLTALKTVLDFGVRITYVGSIDDQLVSLESATFASVSHPHIYRAVFVDGRVHAPSFLSHLVGFALKLRNLGISDHGLIRELSTPLSGSLYSGEGHSRLYDDDAVYRLAVDYTLETTSVPHAVLESQKHDRSPTPNPFILPFAMRGILEEEYVRRELSEETTALLKQFEGWKPSSKVLKDVKFRLEGIRSKL